MNAALFLKPLTENYYLKHTRFMLRRLRKYLLPFALIYGFVVKIRNFLYDMEILRSVEFDVPVIGVGNITVGGTGKTPHVEYLVRFLGKQHQTAVLSRGYRRLSGGFVQAAPGVTAGQIGDEPLQIYKKFPHLTLAVDADRIRGIRLLLEKNPSLEVIILDDAFQHRRVKPGLMILLIDHNRMITDDLLLPAGNLREPVSGIQRAHIIIVTKCPPDMKPVDGRIIESKLRPLPHQKVFFSFLRYGNLIPVYENAAPPLPPEKLKLKNPHVFLLSGIANPLPFHNYMEQFASRISFFVFPDHHRYSPRDLLKIFKAFDQSDTPEKYIVTTEKDAMRLQTLNDMDDDIRKRFYYLPVEVGFSEEDEKLFQKEIVGFIHRMQQSRIISSYGT